MKKYGIKLSLTVYYEVEAESESEAIEIADNYWLEAIPETDVFEIED